MNRPVVQTFETVVHIQCTTRRQHGRVALAAIFLLLWLQPPGRRFKRADTLLAAYQTATDVPVFPPDTSGREGGWKEGKGASVNEVLVELPEGEPGDLTCRQMMGRHCSLWLLRLKSPLDSIANAPAALIQLPGNLVHLDQHMVAAWRSSCEAAAPPKHSYSSTSAPPLPSFPFPSLLARLSVTINRQRFSHFQHTGEVRLEIKTTFLRLRPGAPGEASLAVILPPDDGERRFAEALITSADSQRGLGLFRGSRPPPDRGLRKLTWLAER